MLSGARVVCVLPVVLLKGVGRGMGSTWRTLDTKLVEHKKPVYLLDIWSDAFQHCYFTSHELITTL
jgi:hypothetical protein